MKEIELVDHEYTPTAISNPNIIARTRSRYVDGDYDDMTNLAEENFYNELIEERRKLNNEMH